MQPNYAFENWRENNLEKGYIFVHPSSNLIFWLLDLEQGHLSHLFGLNCMWVIPYLEPIYYMLCQQKFLQGWTLWPFCKMPCPLIHIISWCLIQESFLKIPLWIFSFKQIADILFSNNLKSTPTSEPDIQNS